MTNILTILLIAAIIYWIKIIISRKKKELSEKELIHRKQFLKETQSLLETIPNKAVNGTTTPMTSNHTFMSRLNEYFTSKGFMITESSKTDGIDLIGIKENELALIRCENRLKEIKTENLKEFIADCTVYTDTHPILNDRKIRRYYATDRTITQEGYTFVRNHPSILILVEL